MRWSHFATTSKFSENMTKKTGITIPDEVVMDKILVIRDKKVMIDSDLAELYGVTTKRLNEQVKRNIQRFPEDFMFQITQEEKQDLIKTKNHLTKLKFSPNLPFVFTEHGAVMLASVVNSDRAIAVNIQIVRIFIHIREMILTHKDILMELEAIKQKVGSNSNDIELIFNYLKQFEAAKQQELEQQQRAKIGYKTKK